MVRGSAAVQTTQHGDPGLFPEPNPLQGTSMPRAAKLDPALAREVTAHILEHQGPDSRRWAHPSIRYIPLATMEVAMAAAREQGLSPLLRPYHFERVMGLYSDPRIVPELVVKKIDILLRDKYGGELIQLIQKAGNRELFGAFTEIIEGRNVTVSMAKLGSILNNKPSAMVEVYLQEKGLKEEFRDLQPFHFGRISVGASSDPEILRALTLTVCDHHLEKTFGGDMTRMLREIERADLKKRVESTLAGHQVTINGKTLDGEVYPILLRYLAAKGLTEKYKDFRPYHANRTAHCYRDDPAFVDQVIVEKLDGMLKDQFSGDLARMIGEATAGELTAPMPSTLGGEPCQVVVKTIIERAGVTCYDILKRYLIVKKQSELAERLRPEHCAEGTGSTIRSLTDSELLVRKVTQLAAEKFEGSLGCLIRKTSYRELSAPLRETVAGMELSIGMFGVAARLGGSPFALIKSYLYTSGQSDAWIGLKPYHLSVSARGTWDDQSSVDAVIARRVEELVDGRFGGSIARFIQEASSDDMVAPMVDRIGGEEFNVPISSVMSECGTIGNALRRYFKVHGLLEQYQEFRDWFVPYNQVPAHETNRVRDEVTLAKIDYLLEQKYQGNIGRLVAGLTSDELKEPYEVMLGNEVFAVAPHRMVAAFQQSPWRTVDHYLMLTGQEDLRNEVRPWHYERAGRNTYSNITERDELLRRKCSHILNNLYGGDPIRMIEEIDDEAIRSPFPQTIAGHTFDVHVEGLMKEFPGGYFHALQRYFEIDGFFEIARDLRPYHLSRTTTDTYCDDALVDEVVIKRVGALLEQTYGGDLVKFVREMNAAELLSPFGDAVADRSVTVSFHSAFNAVGKSLYATVHRYLRAVGMEEAADELRPYMFSRAGRDTYAEQDYADELLVKSVDTILDTRFEGDLNRMISEVKLDDLLAPTIVTFMGSSIEVSAFRWAQEFKQSPRVMIARYLELTGRGAENAAIRPYHYARAGVNTFTDQRIVDEVIVKKVDKLLGERFNGSIDELLLYFDLSLFSAPFRDDVAGMSFEVSTLAAAHALGGSPYAILERYHTAKGLKFDIPRLCLSGTPDTRKRRMEGRFSHYDVYQMRRMDGSYDSGIYGLKNYNSDDKRRVREVMAECGAARFEDRPVRYAGLETEQLFSIRLLRDTLNVDLAHSVVIEREPRRYNAILVMKRRFAADGEKLRPLNVMRGDIEQVIPSLPSRYNFFNLDYLGHMSRGKEIAIKHIFEAHKVESEALIFVTLSNTPLDRKRAETAGYSADQPLSLVNVVNYHAAQAGFEVEIVAELPYSGGTSDARKRDMLCMGFALSRRS